MEYIYPDYYHKFQCAADRCPDTCCAGWQISIDRLTMKKYLHGKGAFGNRLKNSVNVEESCFYHYDGKCVLLNEKNLCDICLEVGEEHLCKACADYPRHTEEYENARELSLSLSCPEAAKMILGRKEPVRIVSVIKGKKEEKYQEFDLQLYAWLKEMRRLFLDIIQRRELSMANRMALVTAMAHDFQRKISKERYDDLGKLAACFGNPAFAHDALHRFDKYRSREGYRYHLIQEMLMCLHEFEILNEEWNAGLWSDEWTLYGTMTRKDYILERKEFLHDYREWEIQKEQLLVYFIFVYFCGGIYDGRIYTKVKTCMVHILLIEELLFAEWLKGERSFDLDAQVEVVHRYARTAEHSDWNLEHMENLVKKRRVFSLEKLLIAVLNG